MPILGLCLLHHNYLIINIYLFLADVKTMIQYRFPRIKKTLSTSLVHEDDNKPFL